MGRHCELCGTHEDQCKDRAVHWPEDAAGQRLAREVRKRWREQKRQKYQVAAATEQLFCRDVVALSESLTGWVFSRMAWEGRAVDRPAVVWMHGDFEGGRTYEVQMPCSAVVQMRVERASGPAPTKSKASEEPA